MTTIKNSRLCLPLYGGSVLDARDPHYFPTGRKVTLILRGLPSDSSESTSSAGEYRRSMLQRCLGLFALRSFQALDRVRAIELPARLPESLFNCGQATQAHHLEQ
jgi:hypothetical protein